MSGTTRAELTHRLSHDVGSLLGWIKRPDAVDYSTGDVPFLAPKAKSRENGASCLTCYMTHRPPASKGIRLIPKEVISALADMTSFLIIQLVDKGSVGGWEHSPLVPLKQIPRIDLVRHVRELVAPAVCDDSVAAGFKGLQVMHHLAPEELRRVQRGPVDHHGHAPALHALHDALDGARAEVVGVGLHRQAVDAHDWLRIAGVDAVPHHLQHLVGDEVLAGAVGVHDGLDQVLRHVLVVCEQLLGVLWQTVTAVAEAGVVVVTADARLGRVVQNLELRLFKSNAFN